MNNDLDTVKIGNYIAERRRGLGLTQQGLAERLNVTNKAVSKWETGQGAPDIGTLPLLAEVLQVTVDEILKGESAPRLGDADEKTDGGKQEAFTVQTPLSRQNLLLCAKACWLSLYAAPRLICLFSGIVLLSLAFAVAGASRLTAYRVPTAAVALPAAAGAIFLLLSMEGYRLLKILRTRRAAEEKTCTFHFMDDGFSADEQGMKKSWRYEHVTQLLETKELLVILCGRDMEFIKKQSLPADQWEALLSSLRAHCPDASYRNLSKGRPERIAGLFFAGAALLILLFQLGYLFVHAKYGVVYQAEWIAYLINFVGLVFIFLSSVFLAEKKPAVWVWVGVLCGALMIADIADSLIVSVKTQDIVSFSPNGRNELVLKRDTSTGKVEQYRCLFLFFARPYRQFPYTVYGKIKTQWLAGDICAVTYISEQNGPSHQMVATFGDRGRDNNYYVEAALDGSWEPSGQNTAGWRLTRDTKGIVLSNGSTEYDYGTGDCVQYGLTALVLCRNGLPQWTVALNEDCKIDTKTLLVSYGGTLTLCQVSMSPTAPLVLRSTSKSSVSGGSALTQTSAKDTYRVRDGVLSFTWDYGHRWTALKLSKDAVSSILKNGSSTRLADGCWHVADDSSYVVYGTSPLTILFSSNGGASWETHPVADLTGDDIASRYAVVVSSGAMEVAVGFNGTPDLKGSSLFTTSDGGLTWKSRRTPSTQMLTGMNFLDQDIGYLSYTNATGDSGELFETKDGGRSFAKVKLPAGNLAEVGSAASGLTFRQVYDTPQVPYLENGTPVLYVTQGSDGDFGTYRVRYESKDGGKTWRYVSQEKKSSDSGS